MSWWIHPEFSVWFQTLEFPDASPSSLVSNVSSLMMYCMWCSDSIRVNVVDVVVDLIATIMTKAIMIMFAEESMCHHVIDDGQMNSWEAYSPGCLRERCGLSDSLTTLSVTEPPSSLCCASARCLSWHASEWEDTHRRTHTHTHNHSHRHTHTQTHTHTQHTIWCG